jgi:hypothetical protein
VLFCRSSHLILLQVSITHVHSVTTPAALWKMSESDPGFLAAVAEAKAGFEEGGVPIGACLVAADGRILGRGHNMRVQKGSATLHVS